MGNNILRVVSQEKVNNDNIQIFISLSEIEYIDSFISLDTTLTISFIYI